MRRVVILCAVVGAMVFLSAGMALTQPPNDNASGRYIVVLKDGVDSPGQVAAEISRRNNAEVGFVYRSALKGFSVVVPNSRVAEVRADKRVDYVERDGTMKTVAQRLPWGIDKIEADLSSTKAGDGTGSVSNVNAYIIDTGIDDTHADLNVVGQVNFAGGPNRDCNGHGTHVSGTVAARDNTIDVVGVAPGAPLTGVKVLGCGGSGSTSGVIKGVDWVTAKAAKPAIANMSLGGSASNALDKAVRDSAASGVFYSLAAGNDEADACGHSPARAGTTNGVMTTAATNSADQETSWSNYGSCVDIWAPGESILSTRKGGGTTTMSGTSMASPHTGGTGALYLSTHTGASAAAVEGAIKGAATPKTTTSKDGRSITLLNAGSF
ncbi:MAG TPA: S8 family serine peptidase [Rubrobacter sp.]|nr:S8 family serine peptidase [Rubrobacter sp.]